MPSDVNNERVVEREMGISGSVLARTLGLLDRTHLENLLTKYIPIPHMERIHRNTLVTLLVAQDSPDLRTQVMRLIGRELDAPGIGEPAIPRVAPHKGRPPGSRNRPK